MKKRILCFILTIAMLVGLTPTNIFSITAMAVAATAVTLTDNSGNQTVITAEDNTVGTGYTYDAETNTLTLNNWMGKKIQANGDLNIHLKGTNTITMADSDPYGIKTDDKTITVTSDDGASLNVVGTGLTKYVYGIAANVVFHTGTINVDIDTSNGGYGIYGGFTFAEGETKAAVLNVNVEKTATDNTLIAVGGMDDFTIQNCQNAITVNINATTVVDGAKVEGMSSGLYIKNSAPQMTVTADNNGGSVLGRMAFDDIIDYLSLNECGKVTFNGTVRYAHNYFLGLYIGANTVVTTPANSAYMWKADSTIETNYNNSK